MHILGAITLSMSLPIALLVFAAKQIPLAAPWTMGNCVRDTLLWRRGGGMVIAAVTTLPTDGITSRDGNDASLLVRVNCALVVAFLVRLSFLWLNLVASDAVSHRDHRVHDH